MNCPFCTNEIKNSVFWESDNFMALYNIAPILPGHSLIISKKHLISVLDLSDNLLSEMMLFAKRVTGVLLEAYQSDSFNWSVQDNDVAGQTVSHLHLHIVPRLKGDMTEPGDWYMKISDNDKEILDSNQRPKISQKQMKEIVAKLKCIVENRSIR